MSTTNPIKKEPWELDDLKWPRYEKAQIRGKNPANPSEFSKVVKKVADVAGSTFLIIGALVVIASFALTIAATHGVALIAGASILSILNASSLTAKICVAFGVVSVFLFKSLDLQQTRQFIQKHLFDRQPPVMEKDYPTFRYW